MKYFMGIDDGGYDSSTFTICVIREDKVVEFVAQTRDKKEYEKEVRRLQKHYNIPDNQILWETE